MQSWFTKYNLTTTFGALSIDLTKSPIKVLLLLFFIQSLFQARIN